LIIKDKDFKFVIYDIK